MVFRIVNTAIVASILFLVCVIAFAIFEKSPNDPGLEQDLSTTRERLSRLEEESKKYEGGLLKTLIELEQRTLGTTIGMLEQKQASILHRIRLEYRVDLRNTVQPASPERLTEIEKDIANAEQKAVAAQSEAAKYSGGLVQAMALSTAATEQFSISILRLKYFSEKYGLGIELPPTGRSEKSNDGPPGKVVRDKDAL
jgi:hypothetical protein